MKSYNVMIVEDNLIIANGIRSALTENDYNVIKIVRSGRDAIDFLKDEQPHLILMDISLKGDIDGISTARIVNRHYNIPIVFITKHTDRDIFLNAKETAPRNYITKPFSTEELIRVVDLALGDSIVCSDGNKPDEIRSSANDGIFVYTKEHVYEKLLFTDILYIESVGAYSKIYYEREGLPAEKPYTVSISSNHVVSQMEHPDIVKVHRSYYVNINKINRISNNHIFINDVSVRISDKIKTKLFNETFNILRKPS